MKRIIVAVLLACMTVTAFTSCANTSDDQSGNESNLPTGSLNTEAPGDVYDVPSVTYDGHEMLILSSGNVVYDDFSYDEASSAVLDNAQYVRKATVETNFDIDIVIEKSTDKTSFGQGSGFQKVSQAVTSEDCTYEICLIGTYDSTNLAVNNYLYDLNSIDYINLNNSWWDQNANSDLSINGLMFFTTGDFSCGNNDATFTLVFNKDLAETAKIENPYELVTSGKWTYDKLAEMTRTVSEDVNGDGQMDMRDKYGMTVWDDSVMAAVNSAGVRVCTVKDGKVELTFNEDRTIAVFNKWAEMVYDKEHAITYQRFGSSNGTIGQLWEEGRALFRNCLIKTVHSIRLAEVDFGILPYPKLTEDQDRYYSTMGSYHGQFVCVPLYQDDIERVGIIAESLAYYGQQLVRPAYYDKTLYGQTFRDDESKDMLDVILSSYIYDFGWYYQIGEYNENLMDLIRAYSTDFASMYASNEVAAKTKLTTINDAYAAVLDGWQS